LTNGHAASSTAAANPDRAGTAVRSRGLSSAAFGRHFGNRRAPGALREGVDVLLEEPNLNSFEEVYLASRLPMLRVAYLVVGSHAVAEELVQEAFMRLHRNFESVGNPGGYLRTIVVRLSVAARKRSAAEAERERGAYEPPPTGEPAIDAAWDALACLRPERRAVVVLRYYEDLQPAEIAKLLDWREATVRSRLHRALADLRRELAE
jgi:RNA polymerase sigma factor (sigma-70 family)